MKQHIYGRLADAAIAGAITRHPRTGLPAVGFRKDGTPIWPIAGGSGEGTGTLQRSPFLQSLYDERTQLEEFLDQTINGAMTGGPDGGRRDLSATEQETLKRTRERITALDGQIAPLEDYEKLKANGDRAARDYRPRPSDPGQGAGGAGAGHGQGGQSAGAGRTGLGLQVQHRAHQYRSRGEVIVDQLIAAPVMLGGRSDPGARERLLSAGVIYHGVSDADVEIARQKADADAERINQAAVDRMYEAGLPQERVTQVSSDTPGILPVPIIGQVMSDVDAARPFITSIGPQGMAFAGASFSRPVIGQHTQAGKQTTQATSTGVGSRKLLINGVTFNKETWGDTLDVSRQEIDWTSPAAWDAILNDLQEQYGLETENAAADAFAAAVPAATAGSTVATGAQPLSAWITALYAAASTAYTGAGRLPDTIWASLDMWSTLGPLIESQVASNQQPGSSEVSTFQGNLLRLPRIVVPSFPNGTLVLGAKRWTEVYEERIGLLQAVLPSAFGVQVAYGGYVAYNTLKAAAFGRVTKTP